MNSKPDADNVYQVFNFACRCVNRSWHRTARAAHQLHPAVNELLKLYRPARPWDEILLEWPHVSETPDKLAFYPNERAGEALRGTITTPGRYIKKYWPQLSDDQIRDRVAVAIAGGCEILTDMDEMVRAVMHGPKSCMKSHLEKEHEFDYHPYRCYDPKHGWGLAVQKDNRRVIARALVNRDSEDNGYFVRTFEQGVSTRASTTLNAWLRSQGYEHRGEWEEGTMLELIEDDRCRTKAPYLDGNNNEVDLDTRAMTMTIVYNGEHTCRNPNGFLDEDDDDENSWTCDHCEESQSEDDASHSVGYEGNSHVCERCADRHYTYVYGRRREQYYVRDGAAMGSTNGNDYDEDYLEDNGQIALESEYEGSDCCPEDDAVYVDNNGYYHLNDSDIVYLEGRNEYRLKEDCTEIDDAWYLSEDCVKDGAGVWVLEDNAVKDFKGIWWHEDDTWTCEDTGEVYHTDIAPYVIDDINYHSDSDTAKYHKAGLTVPTQQELEIA